MCFRDLIQTLRREGIELSDQQVRWALRTGKISRPRLDGSLRFVFDQNHVEELRELAQSGRTVTRQVA